MMKWYGPELDSGRRGNKVHMHQHDDDSVCTFDDSLNRWRRPNGLYCGSCNYDIRVDKNPESFWRRLWDTIIRRR